MPAPLRSAPAHVRKDDPPATPAASAPRHRSTRSPRNTEQNCPSWWLPTNAVAPEIVRSHDADPDQPPLIIAQYYAASKAVVGTNCQRSACPSTLLANVPSKHLSPRAAQPRAPRTVVQHAKGEQHQGRRTDP